MLLDTGERASFTLGWPKPPPPPAVWAVRLHLTAPKPCDTMNLTVTTRCQSDDTGWKILVPNGRNRTASGAGAHGERARRARTCDIAAEGAEGRTYISYYSFGPRHCAPTTPLLSVQHVNDQFLCACRAEPHALSIPSLMCPGRVTLWRIERLTPRRCMLLHRQMCLTASTCTST